MHHRQRGGFRCPDGIFTAADRYLHPSGPEIGHGKCETAVHADDSLHAHPIYAFGVAAAFTYTHLMAIVTQGTLKHLRVDMFDKMQSLPIKYFDTHAHGDIMSTYTNDTDAIRQMIGQSAYADGDSSRSLTITGHVPHDDPRTACRMTIVVCLFCSCSC